MLALSVREALRQAIAGFGPAGMPVVLEAQTTPEAVFWAVQEAQSSVAGAADSSKSAEHSPALADL
jgi:xanthine dehydrogenase large subunit